MRNNQIMHTVLVVAFPFILVGFEAGFRFLVREPVWDFVGPSLCVAGLSFLVSATRIRTTQVAVSGTSAPSATVDDSQVVPGVYLAILLGILLWGVSLYFSARSADTTFMLLPIHAVIGIFIYVASVIIFQLRGES